MERVNTGPLFPTLKLHNGVLVPAGVGPYERHVHLHKMEECSYVRAQCSVTPEIAACMHEGSLQPPPNQIGVKQ
jgi:hypothetical protein